MILTDINSLSGINSNSPQRAREEACREFESIFAYQMLKSMADTVPEDGILESDSGGKLYKDLFNMEAARAMTRGDGLGIARIIQDQLMNLNEKSPVQADKV
jgi:flagellar protein FlgJ